MAKKIKDWFIDRFYNKQIQPYIDKYGIDEVRQRLYDGIQPVGYNSAKYRIKRALRGDKVNSSMHRDDIWAEYLQIPKNKRHKVVGVSEVMDSHFKPKNSKENIIYKRIPLLNYEKENLIQDYYKKDRVKSKDKLSRTLGFYFGEHTIDSGFDDIGQYISYYDKWDIAPASGKGNVEDESRGIGKPIEFYDRIYLDDVYNIPKNDRGNPYIAPAIIKAEKKLGGMKKVREKKWIGAALSAVASIAGSEINAAQQNEQLEAQQRQQRLNQNIANTNAYISNMNQVANTNNDWVYDKFRPQFKCGGKRKMKANLGKYKPRFDK